MNNYHLQCARTYIADTKDYVRNQSATKKIAEAKKIKDYLNDLDITRMKKEKIIQEYLEWCKRENL